MPNRSDPAWNAEWRAERDELVALETEQAKALVGKTVAKACVRAVSEEYDDVCQLILEMTDGTKFLVEGGYGGYTGASSDEYQTLIGVRSLNED